MSVSSLSSRRAVSSRFLSFYIHAPCRDLPYRASHGMAVLPDQQDTTPVIHCHNPHSITCDGCFADKCISRPRGSACPRRMDTIFPAYSVLLSNTFGIIIQNLLFLSDGPRLCQPIIISHYITLSFPCHFFLPAYSFYHLCLMINRLSKIY